MHTAFDAEAEDGNLCEPQSIKSPLTTRKKSFKNRLNSLIFALRLQALKGRDQDDSGAVETAIRNCALELANDKSTTFAQEIANFIECTKDSTEDSPQVVMRNMRQFMTGMKRYLVNHGDMRFDKKVKQERRKLKAPELLDLDNILEEVLHCLVVSPLKHHLNSLFINKYSKTGAILLLAENIKYANTRPASELAIEPKITLPNKAGLQTIQECLTHLQEADSPLEKLHFLLATKTAIYKSVKITQSPGAERNMVLSADDFLPLFAWVLVKAKFVVAEIEAEYMWGLLDADSLSGEGEYYLTTLSSVVHVLKNFKDSTKESIKNNLKTDMLRTCKIKKTHSLPPPRSSTLTTRQNTYHSTRVTFSVNSGPQNISHDHEIACGPKRMLPEEQTSIMSSKDSLGRARENVTSPKGPVLSSNSDPNSLNEKTPPTPLPRRSKQTTRQNNYTVTTPLTFSVDSRPQNISPDHEVACDPKRTLPEGQTSTMSLKGSMRRAPENVTSPKGSILSPNSDSNSLNEKKSPAPLPRWSKLTTRQNNYTVTTPLTFSDNSGPQNTSSDREVACDPKRTLPEEQTSTISTKGSLRRTLENVTSPNSSVLSPNSDPNSLMSPDTLSPLSVRKTRSSKQRKQKISKHYQESNIVDSPPVIIGDKISNYEDLRNNENSKNLPFPDLLQHTPIVLSLNNNVLSPTESNLSHCSSSTPNTTNNNQNSDPNDSPTVYNRSAIRDKIRYYEDFQTNTNNKNKY